MNKVNENDKDFKIKNVYSTFKIWSDENNIAKTILKLTDQRQILNFFSTSYNVPILIYNITEEGDVELFDQINSDFIFNKNKDKNINDIVHLLNISDDKGKHWVTGKGSDILLKRKLIYNSEQKLFVLTRAFEQIYCELCRRYYSSKNEHKCGCHKCHKIHFLLLHWQYHLILSFLLENWHG